ARLVGTTGKVYAIEPIPLFGDIWIKNVKPEQNQQAMLLPFALGKEKGTVQMGMPTKNGRLHHGMTKIASSAQEQYVHMFDVDMQNPDELFADIPALDFIKCDVEGYESVVFDNMQHTISRFRPLVQTELSGDENRQHVIDFFTSRNYSCAVLKNNSLTSISKDDAMKLSQDFYFIPK
ncbi:MAG: FkbM family methyltransferase, partial [Bacteroidales bacterium]|nr:FkbM family methyltransferase [Bacteroidales bacterium]